MSRKFEPLSNGEIDVILKNVKGFKGTLAKDQFKGKIKPLECGVINMDDSTGPGTHYIAYYNSPESEFVYYYDSYAVYPPKNIEKYLLTSGKTIAYNNSQHQDIGSVICGYYCIMFIICLSKRVDFYDFLEMFGNDYKKNDKFVMNWAIQNKLVK